MSGRDQFFRLLRVARTSEAAALDAATADAAVQEAVAVLRGRRARARLDRRRRIERLNAEMPSPAGFAGGGPARFFHLLYVVRDAETRELNKAVRDLDMSTASRQRRRRYHRELCQRARELEQAKS